MCLASQGSGHRALNDRQSCLTKSVDPVSRDEIHAALLLFHEHARLIFDAHGSRQQSLEREAAHKKTKNPSRSRRDSKRFPTLLEAVTATFPMILLR
jgi:hypothetical protein